MIKKPVALPAVTQPRDVQIAREKGFAEGQSEFKQDCLALLKERAANAGIGYAPDEIRRMLARIAREIERGFVHDSQQ